MTLFFMNDYSKGAHPDVLVRLLATNDIAQVGYGEDKYTKRAKEHIRQTCQLENAEVFLLVGGTQTNAVVISSLLRSYEGVIAATTGHISVHEAGAIEYTGHKVIELPQTNGKLSAKSVREYVENFHADETKAHCVAPGMVYISYPTEYGTLYTKQELTELYQVCQEYNLPLFIDGARLGYGLAANECDLDLPTLARLCDVFYIGGTKVGALCGEAVVFSNPTIMPKNYPTIIKQHGALLAKGRVLGVQFETLFTNQLYFTISKHAVQMATVLKKGLQEKGYRFYIDSPTNQQFVILENQKMEAIKEFVQFAVWEAYDSHHTVVRFVTDWATKQEDVEALLALL